MPARPRTPRLRFGLVVLAVVLACAGCDWLSFGGGPGHTGVNAFENGVTTSSVPSFVASTLTGAPTTGEVAIVGRLVLVQRDGALTAYDSLTSGVVWVGALPPGSTLGSAPAVDPASNTVFVVVSQATN